jgi:tetratricopeptide (TPR) repeat protein
MAVPVAVRPPEPAPIPMPVRAPTAAPSSAGDHGGHRILGLVCDGQVGSRALAAQLAGLPDRLAKPASTANTEALERALAAEPNAGQLYVALADAVLLAGAPDAQAAALLESAERSCPESWAMDELSSALRVAGGKPLAPAPGRAFAVQDFRTAWHDADFAGAQRGLEPLSEAGDPQAVGLEALVRREVATFNAVEHLLAGRAGPDELRQLRATPPSSPMFPELPALLARSRDNEVLCLGCIGLAERVDRELSMKHVVEARGLWLTHRVDLNAYLPVQSRGMERRIAAEAQHQALIHRVDGARSPKPKDLAALAEVPRSSAFFADARELMRREGVGAPPTVGASSTEPGLPAVAEHSSSKEQAAALRKQGLDLIMAGDSEAALPLLRRAVDLDGSAPENVRALAGCYARLNRFKDAAVYYRRFLELAPGDPAAPTVQKALRDYENSE